MQYITIEIGSSSEAHLSAWAMKSHVIHLDVLIRNTKTLITEEGGIQLQFEATPADMTYQETNPNFPGIKVILGPPTARKQHPCSTEDILPLKDLHLEHFLNEEWPHLWFDK